jgi:spore coat polysaccharide biosynthesis predicted glycosyltransferase SpsG/RimJ/RimL family protein N-acetyltransferase
MSQPGTVGDGPRPRVAVYARFGADVGFGHVSRCAAVASALRTLGAEPLLFSAAPARLPDWLAASFGQTAALDPADGDGRAAASGPFAWLVIDDYTPDPDRLALLAAAADAVAAICDDPDASAPSGLDRLDLRLCPTPRAAEDAAAAVDGGDDAHGQLIGPAYAMLRPAFAKARFVRLRDQAGAPDVHTPPDAGTPPRAVIAPGGGDPAGLGAQLLPTLLDAGWSADVILAGGAPALDEIRRVAADRPERVRVHTDLDAAGVADLLRGARFWLGTASTACWERCTLGVPGTAFVTADNQRALGARLAERGLSVVALDTGGRIPDAARAQLGADLAAAATAPVPDGTALQVCDGLGAYRVAAALVAPRDKQGRRVTVHPVRHAHADLLYAWQSHPLTRRFARVRSVPDRAEHTAWLSRRLADPRCVLSLIRADGEAVACVRLDLLAAQASAADVRSTRPSGASGEELVFEISIYVNPPEYGRGVGKAALRQAAALTPFAWRRAEVLPSNEKSLALFRSVGYRGCRKLMLQGPAKRPAAS